MTKIVAISDTHDRHTELTIPECDILIHAGDWSFQGTKSETENFAKWLDKQPAKNIIVIPGNHEKIFENVYPESKAWILDHCPRANLLINESIELEGIKFYGSPWTPYFHNWGYQGARNQAEHMLYKIPRMKDLWSKVPEDTNVLISHGPAYQILDYAPQCGNVGDLDLFKRILELPELKVHMSGHIHYSYGHKEFNGVKYYNVSNCTEAYKCTNPVTVIEYDES